VVQQPEERAAQVNDVRDAAAPHPERAEHVEGDEQHDQPPRGHRDHEEQQHPGSRVVERKHH